jgi:mismatch-specific thymine-DNA glycosylase
MSIERILVGGKEIDTLAERLRPGLRAIIVGINPSPVSVLAGHYYQGQLGKRLWRRLVAHGILHDLPAGKEDDAAFAQGFGFADLIRRPTATSAELSGTEITAAVPGLVKRLRPYRTDNPLILYVFKAAERATAPSLQKEGFRTVRLPGPYLAQQMVNEIMSKIARELR